MTTNLTPKTDVLVTEAAASWNTRYITPDGFECQLTLRGDNGQEVLEKASAAIVHLLKNNCQPYTYMRSPKSNGKPAATTTPSESNAPSNGNGQHPEQGWCPIHNCEMKRWEKDGRIWYSHKVDGQWCSGKAKRS